MDDFSSEMPILTSYSRSSGTIGRIRFASQKDLLWNSFIVYILMILLLWNAFKWEIPIIVFNI